MKELEARRYSLGEALALHLEEQPNLQSEALRLEATKHIPAVQSTASASNAKHCKDELEQQSCSSASNPSDCKQLSWEVGVKYEPRLLGLVRRIEAIKRKNFELRGKRKLRYRYAQECWYGYGGKPSIKEELCGIVGWDGDTEHEALRSAVAYDICYSKLFRMLSR
ncbi:hypothetical protein [Truepera radiovictrix]|uniref:hypothetical protein n=1 Tax=Truepera radiovictrix TaxID=332249 RepID=UPI0011D12D7D|nr:hypothetical protein [Truepera radiovictrix]WMT56521.1 hypothetical protein RCV51_10965 [Truepera radiovictrix]